MRSEVPPVAGMADSATTRVELPATHGTSLGTGRRKDSAVEAGTLAGDKKNAEKQGRTIVFIDESGLSQRPHRCRTWAPRGQTPVLQYHFNWKTLSAMAGVTWWNFYFRLFPGSIRSPQVVEFLSHLLRHIPAGCWWFGTGSRAIAVVWSGTSCGNNRDASGWNSCPPTLRN